MRTAHYALLLLTTIIISACAPEGIIPTPDKGSDCVAAVITVMRQQEVVPFFTDRCNASNEEAYISFNGETRRIWRQPENPHSDVTYAGTWKGDNVLVRITPRELIGRFEDDRVTYAVDVFIQSGNKNVTFQATYDNRL